MKKLLFIPLALSVVMVNAQSLSRKAVFAKGQQLEQVAVTKMNLSMEMMGQSISMDNSNTATSLIAVKSATGKDYAIESTLKRVVMNINGMGQEMNYDSDKKDEAPNPIGEKMNELVGKAHHLTVDTKGFITATDDSTGNEIAEKAGGFMGMAEDFTGTSYKPGKSYGLVADLPAKALKVGDTWIDSSTSKEGKMLTNYKVLEIKGEEAIIDMSGTMTQSGKTEANGMTVNLALTGKTKGQYTMDVATGIIKKRNNILEAAGTMEVMGQSVPFTMKINGEEIISKK
jgi:hypothetical protein